MAQRAIATKAMLAMFPSMAPNSWVLAMLPRATSAAPTTNPGVDASVETVLRVKWHGKIAAGKGIAIRQSVT